MKIPRKQHPSTAALNRFLLSPEGRKCSEGSAAGEYLANRITSAFLAGWDGREAERQKNQKRIRDLEVKIAKYARLFCQLPEIEDEYRALEGTNSASASGEFLCLFEAVEELEKLKGDNA